MILGVCVFRQRSASPAGDLLSTKQTKTRETNRRIGSNVLGHTGSIADLSVQFVLVDAVGASGFSDVAGATGEHKAVVGAVFLGVEQVGARNKDTEISTSSSHETGTGKEIFTIRDRNGSEPVRQACCRQQQKTERRTLLRWCNEGRLGIGIEDGCW